MWLPNTYTCLYIVQVNVWAEIDGYNTTLMFSTISDVMMSIRTDQ